jgi:hypothetical protein
MSLTAYKLGGATPETVASSENFKTLFDLIPESLLSESGSDEDIDPLSPMTIQTSTTRSHLDLWQDPMESLIIFDWDDTLCPTSFIVKEAPDGDASDLSVEDQEALRRHIATVTTVLSQASALSRVSIVTLATEKWLEDTIKNFMPSIRGVLEDLEVEIIYARGSLPNRR